MNVALIADTRWLDEELPMFQQLVVGLLAEGVGVVQVVPEGMASSEFNGFGKYVAWNDGGWAVVRDFRLVSLVKELEGLGVDMIHAMDASVWRGAVRLGERMGVPVLLTGGSAGAVAAMAEARANAKRIRIGFTASTHALYEQMKMALPPGGSTGTGDGMIQFITPGVHIRERVDVAEATAGQLSVAVCGTEKFDEDCRAFFGALGPIVKAYPQTQFFFDARGRDPHAVWRGARSMGLLSNLSMVPRRVGHHELLLRADVLVHPQPSNGSRGITLQAMAMGVPVVARRDPWSDYLIDGQTAWVIDRPGPTGWEEVMNRCVGSPEEARNLGREARQWVRTNRAVSVMVGKFVEAYRGVATAAIPFKAR